MEKVSDQRTIGPRKCFECPENILSLKNEKREPTAKKEKGEMEEKKNNHIPNLLYLMSTCQHSKTNIEDMSTCDANINPASITDHLV